MAARAHEGPHFFFLLYFFFSLLREKKTTPFFFLVRELFFLPLSSFLFFFLFFRFPSSSSSCADKWITKKKEKKKRKRQGKICREMCLFIFFSKSGKMVCALFLFLRSARLPNSRHCSSQDLPHNFCHKGLCTNVPLVQKEKKDGRSYL